MIFRGEFLVIFDTYYTDRMVVPSSDTGLLLGAWTVGSYCYRAFPAIPYIAITSASPASGKTTHLNLIAHTAYNAPPPGTQPTAAVLFRRAEKTSGVQFFDEADKLVAAKDGEAVEIVNVLNSGYSRDAVNRR